MKPRVGRDDRWRGIALVRRWTAGARDPLVAKAIVWFGDVPSKEAIVRLRGDSIWNRCRPDNQPKRTRERMLSPARALTRLAGPDRAFDGASSSIRSRRAFGCADRGNQPDVADPPHEPSGTPALRYLAILSAAREFGVSTADIEQVVRRVDPLQTSPRELADALADTLTRASKA